MSIHSMGTYPGSLVAQDPSHFQSCRHRHHNEDNANGEEDSYEDFVFGSCAATQSDEDDTERAEKRCHRLVLEFWENDTPRLTLKSLVLVGMEIVCS